MFTYHAPDEINVSNIPLIINYHIGSKIVPVNINIQKNPTPNGSDKIVVLPKSIALSASTTYNIKLITLDSANRPVSTTLSIQYPIDNTTDKIYGTFSTTEVTTDQNGEADITFTSADDLSSLNDINLTVTDELSGTTSKLTLIIPTTSEVVTYSTDISAPDVTSIEKEFPVSVSFEDNNGNTVIADDINLSFENSLIKFTENGSSNIEISNNSDSIVSKNCIVGKFSGIEILKVTADINGTKVTKEYPITVQAGPINTISINFVKTIYNKDLGIFESTYSVHAVDKYSNPAKPGSQIQVGAIVNNKVDSKNGYIEYDDTAGSTKFSDSTVDYESAGVENEDTLIIFATEDRNDPLYLGGWIIDSVIDANTLQLSSEFNGNATNGLYYVVGNERKYDICENTNKIADFDHPDKTYQLDASGTALLTLRYDPYLVGHNVALFVKSYQDKRVGVSLIDFLIGEGYLVYNDTYNYSSIWSKKGEKDQNVSGYFIIAGSGGPKNYEFICPSSTQPPCSLMRDTNVTLTIKTTDVCKFKDNGKTTLDTRTDCNGYAEFNVTYEQNDTCEVQLKIKNDF